MKGYFGLAQLNSTIKKYNINSFDIETFGNENLFYLGGFFDNKYNSFMDKVDMRIYMRDNIKENTIVYATNLGFDYECLYYGCVDYEKRDVIFRGGSMMSCRFDNIEFGDTLSYSKNSVASLGRMLNLSKMKKPKFLGNKAKNKTQLKYLKQYNRMDCYITKKFMENFQEVLNNLGGELKISIASCSMDLYRRKYIPETIYKEKYSEIKDFIFEGYYGGRTECFKRGCINNNSKNKETYYLYDVNSLYPSVMLNEYPKPSSCRKVKPSINNIYMFGVSDVTIKCPYMYYPLLPKRFNNKLIFPTGTFRGVYNHIELEKALKLGYEIIDIHKQIIYTESFKPFYTFVTDLYKLRLQYQKENNGIYSQVVKMLLNSLYGKFATSKISQFEDIDEETSDNLINAYVFENGKGYREIPIECNQAYILPILSSYTTSYARLKLYDYLTKLKGIYCDTDSIITTTKIESSKELGELKLEKVFTKFNIVKPKHYQIYNDLENKYYIKIKGVRLSDKPLDDFNKSIDEQPIEQMRFTKFKESLRAGLKPNTKVKNYKTLSIEDNKRIWNEPYNKNKLVDSKPFNF